MKTPFSLLSYWIICMLFSVSHNSHAQSGFDPCWAITLDGNDPQWPGYENLNISRAARLSDGFVIAGTYFQHIFPSKDNSAIGRTNDGGIYLAKYDFNGNLQWLDYGIDTTYLRLPQKVSIRSVTTDDNDNIYICGKFRRGIPFWYDNSATYTKIASGDTSDITNSIGYFIAKLNSNGQVLWHTHTDMEPWHVTYAPNGKIIVAGELGTYYEQDKDTSWIVSPFILDTWPQSLLWIDTLAGRLDKFSIVRQTGPNYRKIKAITTDKESNLIAIGAFEDNITFYTPGLTDSLSISIPQFTTSDNKFYAVKYDSSGKPLWRVSDDGYLYGGSDPEAVDLDMYGNIYVVSNGKLREYTPDSAFFYNADSSFVVIKKSPVHLYKISKNGFLDWHTGGGVTRGCGISVSDTVLSVVGYSHYGLNPTRFYDTFYSVSSNSFVRLPNECPNIAIARYDTSGVIRNAASIGASDGKNIYTYLNVLPSESEGLIIYGQYSVLQSATYLKFYSDILRLNGIDGFVLKYTPGICDSLDTLPIPPQIAFREPFTDTVLCGGDRIVVYADVIGVFPSGNRFRVELSDANGSFNTAQTIGEVVAGFIDSIVCTIPASTPTDSGYRLRIVSTTPYSATGQNNHKIHITHPLVPDVTISATPDGKIQPGTSVTFTAIPSNGGILPTYRWKLNGVPIAGVDTGTYTTHALQNNDIVSVVMYSSEPCIIPDSSIDISYVSVTDTSVTGLSNHLPASPLTIYPNPNTGIFSISGNVNGNIGIELMNNIGQIIHRETLTDVSDPFNHTIRMATDMPGGFYVLRLIMGTNLSILRFSVIR